ncbi:hypothetical protein [Sphaerisporangium fuscum]|uniref:hypothetical protein n=1 Tax=Sphaerisporangium fuscum TaxID=2835868 RepID=UPI001BDD2A97|nr:hypothetical protein [Sphaerisporangium fuscum]
MPTRHASLPVSAPALVPSTVRSAALLWFTAVGAGVFEAVIAVAGMIVDGTASFANVAAGLGIRLVVFVAAIFMAVRMRQGGNWARVALTVILGVFGTLSLVIGPVQWLLAGHTVAEAVAGADGMTLVFTISRIVHLAAVLSAVALMFTTTANAYFRRPRSLKRSSATVEA